MCSVNKMLHMEESLSGFASWKFKENSSRCGKKEATENFSVPRRTNIIRLSIISYGERFCFNLIMKAHEAFPDLYCVDGRNIVRKSYLFNKKPFSI